MIDPMTLMTGASALGSLGQSLGLWGDDEEPAPQVVQQQSDLPDWLKGDIQGALDRYRTASGQWSPTAFQGVGLQPEHLAARGQAGGLDPSRYQGELDYASSGNLPQLIDQFYQDPSAAIDASRASWEQMTRDPMVRGIGGQAVGAGGWGGTQMGTAIGRGVGQAATTQAASETGMQLNAIQQAIQNAMGAQGAARTQAGVTQALPWGDITGQSTLGTQLYNPQWGEAQAQMGLNQQNQLMPLQLAQGELNALSPLAQAFGQKTTSVYGSQPAYTQPGIGSGALAGGLGMWNLGQQFGNQGQPKITDSSGWSSNSYAGG
jgi:hypothetical protein